jgi:hypothetical protein
VLNRSSPARGNRIHVARLSIGCSATELSRDGRRGETRTHMEPSLGGWWAFQLPARAQDLEPGKGFEPPYTSFVAKAIVSSLATGLEPGSGPENRTLPSTLIRGDYRLIRPACTPVLPTVEARAGIEPAVACFADRRLPTWLPRLGGSRRNRTLACGSGDRRAATTPCSRGCFLALIVKEQ